MYLGLLHIKCAKLNLDVIPSDGCEQRLDIATVVWIYASEL